MGEYRHQSSVDPHPAPKGHRGMALPSWYDAWCRMIGLGYSFRHQVLDAVALPWNGKLLDIGCGTGVLLDLARKRWPHGHFFGVDPDAESLHTAQRRMLRGERHVDLRRTYAEVLPFPAASMDACVSTLTLHHLPDDGKRLAAAEMLRVLKPGGVAVVADFGPAAHPVARWLLLRFEKHMYVEANFQGAVHRALEAVGFDAPYVVGRHFPGIEIVVVKKPVTH